MSRRNQNPRAHRAAYAFVVAVVTSACVVEVPELPDEDQELLDRAADYQSFRKVNAEPYASGVKGMINVYVSDEGAAAYAARGPEKIDQADDVPVGTIIVREVLSDTGRVAKLTLMAKGPKGYQPELGDWWFAVTTPDLAPLMGETTDEWQIGRMPECHGCHIPHAGDDFLFGVPADKRT
jgi:hypothetical protein